MKLNTFSARLRQRLLDLGMSQSDLAREIALNRSSITHWLQGEYMPRGKTMLRLSQLLRCEPSWLRGEDSDDRDPGLLREVPPAYLGRFIPADAEAVLTLSWHGFTREVALSRDPERIGKNVLQALDDIDQLYRQRKNDPQVFNVLEKEMAALGIKPEISSAPGVSAAASAGAASAARLVAPESLPTPATAAPSGHTRGPKPAADPAP